MVQSFEAIIGSDGRVLMSQRVNLRHPHRAIVTILDELAVDEVTLFSEAVLAKDWSREEEDEAWAHLQ